MEPPDRYGASIYQVLGMGRLGATAQIATTALFLNSAHGTIAPFTGEDAEHYREARQQGLLFSAGNSGVTELFHLHRVNPNMRVRIVSDGLVGQIYQED
jgi:hypothetical protein